MKRLLALFVLIAGLSPGLLALAGETAWIMSIPHALSDEHIYKVRIRAIDGQAQPEVFRYPASSGTRKVTVELMLDLEWEPDLSASGSKPYMKVLDLEVKAGRSYLLAAKVDVNAPAESQLDQSFWEVFVYREY